MVDFKAVFLVFFNQRQDRQWVPRIRRHSVYGSSSSAGPLLLLLLLPPAQSRYQANIFIAEEENIFYSTRYFLCRQEFSGHSGDTAAVSVGPGNMEQTNGEEMFSERSDNVSSETKYVSCKSLTSYVYIAQRVG